MAIPSGQNYVPILNVSCYCCTVWSVNLKMLFHFLPPSGLLVRGDFGRPLWFNAAQRRHPSPLFYHLPDRIYRGIVGAQFSCAFPSIAVHELYDPSVVEKWNDIWIEFFAIFSPHIRHLARPVAVVRSAHGESKISTGSINAKPSSVRFPYSRIPCAFIISYPLLGCGLGRLWTPFVV